MARILLEQAHIETRMAANEAAKMAMLESSNRRAEVLITPDPPVPPPVCQIDLALCIALFLCL